jgi:hypothetical protein
VAPIRAQKRAVVSSLHTYIIAKAKSHIEILKQPTMKGIVTIVLFLHKIKNPTQRTKIAAINESIEDRFIN